MPQGPFRHGYPAALTESGASMRHPGLLDRTRSHAGGALRVVLLVEDEPDLRELLAQLLAGALERVHVVTAPTGEEALRRMAETPPDVIVTDYKMPGMNGLDFLARARELRPDVPAILMTAFPDVDIAVRAINEARVVSFFKKPVEPDQVLRVVGGVLAAWQPSGSPPPPNMGRISAPPRRP